MQLILNQRFIKQKEKLSVPQIANIQWKERDSITAINFKKGRGETEKSFLHSRSKIQQQVFWEPPTSGTGMFFLLGPTSVLWNGFLVYNFRALSFPSGLCVHAQSLQSCPTQQTLWTVACQVPLSLGIYRQEYWSGLPCPSPGESSQPRDWTCVLPSTTLAGRFFITSTT